MSCSFCSSSSQTVTDSTSKVSEISLADAAQRPAWSLTLASRRENSVQIRTESCWAFLKWRPTKS